MSIVLIRVSPIGHRDGVALVCAGGRASPRKISDPVFPPDDEARGKRLYDLRVEYDLGLREAARAAWLRAADLSAIERGELRPAMGENDEPWPYPGVEQAAEEAIERAYKVAAAAKGTWPPKRGT